MASIFTPDLISSVLACIFECSHVSVDYNEDGVSGPNLQTKSVLRGYDCIGISSGPDLPGILQMKRDHNGFRVLGSHLRSSDIAVEFKLVSQWIGDIRLDSQVSTMALRSGLILHLDLEQMFLRLKVIYRRL